MKAKRDGKFHCPKHGCDATFDEDRKLRGHIGGKHGRAITYSPIEHGTVSGYKKELRRGHKPCGRCKKAWARYIRERRARIEAA